MRRASAHAARPRAPRAPHATFCFVTPSAATSSARRFSPTIAPSACDGKARAHSSASRTAVRRYVRHISA
eukprot:1744747-Prymnesium_polylepis.2